MWEILVVVHLIKATAMFTVPKSYDTKDHCVVMAKLLIKQARKGVNADLTCRKRDWTKA